MLFVCSLVSSSFFLSNKLKYFITFILLFKIFKRFFFLLLVKIGKAILVDDEDDETDGNESSKESNSALVLQYKNMIREQVMGVRELCKF